MLPSILAESKLIDLSVFADSPCVPHQSFAIPKSRAPFLPRAASPSILLGSEHQPPCGSGPLVVGGRSFSSGITAAFRKGALAPEDIAVFFTYEAALPHLPQAHRFRDVRGLPLLQRAVSSDRSRQLGERKVRDRRAADGRIRIGNFAARLAAIKIAQRISGKR